MNTRVKMTHGFRRYEWWTEMQREDEHSYQLVPITTEQDEEIHRNKLKFLLEIIQGHLPKPTCVRYSV